MVIGKNGIVLQRPNMTTTTKYKFIFWLAFLLLWYQILEWKGNYQQLCCFCLPLEVSHCCTPVIALTVNNCANSIAFYRSSSGITNICTAFFIHYFRRHVFAERNYFYKKLQS